MQTVAEYLASYGVTVTPEQEQRLIEIANAYQAAGFHNFWEAMPRFIITTASSRRLSRADNIR